MNPPSEKPTNNISQKPMNNSSTSTPSSPNSKTWYVYILECSDGSFYTGVTNDIEKRMKTHKSGKGSKYVKNKGFFELLHKVKCKDKSTACKYEYKIKKLEKYEKLDFFIKNKNIILS